VRHATILARGQRPHQARSRGGGNRTASGFGCNKLRREPVVRGSTVRAPQKRRTSALRRQADVSYQTRGVDDVTAATHRAIGARDWAPAARLLHPNLHWLEREAVEDELVRARASTLSVA